LRFVRSVGGDGDAGESWSHQVCGAVRGGASGIRVGQEQPRHGILHRSFQGEEEFISDKFRTRFLCAVVVR
jgi:hypothetical protein